MWEVAHKCCFTFSVKAVMKWRSITEVASLKSRWLVEGTMVTSRFEIDSRRNTLSKKLKSTGCKRDG